MNEEVIGCELKAIVAVTNSWGIGKDGGLVTSIKADMRHFVGCTTGHAIIMGRKTLDSFPGGRALKNRRNIVLTRDEAFERENVEVVHSVEEALALVADEAEAWVIGGGEVYRQFMPYLDAAEVTHTHCERDCDTFFENLDESPDWELVYTTYALDDETEELLDGEDGEPIEFCTYERIAE